MMVMGIVFAGMGAPGLFVLFAFVAGLIMIAWFYFAREEEAELAEREAIASDEADERLRDEVAQAVKDSMKGAIKVRCRYCGSLNDEKANKCDSCGATL